MLGFALLFWPFAAIVVTFVAFGVGVKWLIKALQDEKRSRIYLVFFLVIFSVSGIGFLAGAIQLVPKEDIHPFFGPYNVFALYFVSQVFVALLFRVTSAIYDSDFLLLLSASILVGTIIPPVFVLLALGGSQTINAIFNSLW